MHGYSIRVFTIDAAAAAAAARSLNFESRYRLGLRCRAFRRSRRSRRGAGGTRPMRRGAERGFIGVVIGIGTSVGRRVELDTTLVNRLRRMTVGTSSSAYADYTD